MKECEYKDNTIACKVVGDDTEVIDNNNFGAKIKELLMMVVKKNIEIEVKLIS